MLNPHCLLCLVSFYDQTGHRYFVQKSTWGLVIEPEVWRRHDQSLQGVKQVDVLGVGEPLEPKRDKIKELYEDDLSI